MSGEVPPPRPHSYPPVPDMGPRRPVHLGCRVCRSRCGPLGTRDTPEGAPCWCGHEYGSHYLIYKPYDPNHRVRSFSSSSSL